MAIGDPNADPVLAAQLYGAAAPPPDTWPSWVPDHWRRPPDELLAQGIPPPSSAAPFATPALPAPPPEAAPATLQPGIGIPTTALDAAAADATEPPPFGPQPIGAAPWPAAPPPEPPPAPPLPSQLPLPSAVAGPPLPPPPPGGLAPGVAGPPPATMRDLPGLSITTEPPPTYSEQLAQQYAGRVLDIPDDNARLTAWQALSPEERARQEIIWQQRKENELATRQLEESARNVQAARDNLAAMQRADAATKAQMDQVQADVQRIAATKVDPTGGLSGGQKIAGALGAIIGGLVQGRTGAARNAGADALDNLINRGIEAQKADLANQMQGALSRRGLLSEEYARHGDMFRAQETLRIAAYQHALDQLATQAQLYDPRGTTAIRIGHAMEAIGTQRATVMNALGEQTFKRNVEIEKLRQEAIRNERENAIGSSTIAKNNAEALKLLGKLGGGLGGATNPAYTVPTGWFNPFDSTQPIMGKRPIGGHGEDAKERKKVDDELSTYAHVQDYWAKLAALGDRIDYAKSLGESVWKARRGTLESEYDAAKEALTVYLTKELGDKLTQGQLEAQAHRIPDRASVFEAREPGKQIAAAQEDADRDFARDMDLVGIDATPIIRGAQAHRARVQPTPQAESDAAHAALAATPADKDAQAAADAADQRVRAEVAAEQQRTNDIKAARSLAPPPPPIYEDLHRPAGEVAAVREANRATNRVVQLRQKFAEVSAERPAKGLKPGELAAADRAHGVRLGNLAREVIQADMLASGLRVKAHQEAGRNTLEERARAAGVDVDEARARARVGLDPITGGPPAPPPAPPVSLPNRSTPGDDPLNPFGLLPLPNASHLPSKKRGH